MTGSVYAFPKRVKGSQPWTNEELAELYRVVEILGQAGLKVDTETGISDEGDPWFVFCRADTGDVIAHFARIDGQFVAASIAVDETYRGVNFRQIVDRMVKSQPLILPPPTSGTRLWLHPSVILTAFVATALAHSEKAMAADGLRPVEAKWDHHGTFDHAAHGKHHKSWFENLQSLLRAPNGDAKIAHDAEAMNGNGTQSLTLASLIAIAMSALQPVVDKLTVIADFIGEELHGTDTASHSAVATNHAPTSPDMPVIDQMAVKADDSVMVKPQTGDDSQVQTKKFVVDAGSDSQKALTDGAHLAAATTATTQKIVVSADDVPHFAPLPPVTTELTQDTGSPLMLAVQKIAPTAAAPTTLNPDPSSLATPTVISLKDVSPQAQQLLNIRIDNSDGGATSSLDTSQTKSADGSGSLTTSAPQTVIDVTGNNGTQVVNAISQFASSGTHSLGTGFTATADLQQAIAPYATQGHSLTVVLFESSSLSMEVFPFAPGIVFVDERLVSSGQTLNNPGGNLVLDLATGGSVTLVGVTTVNQPAAHLSA